MKKHLIAIIIVSVVCIACGFGVSLFSGRLSKLEKEIVDLQGETRSLESQAALLTAQKQVSPVGTNLDELNAYFIGGNGALGFVEYIEDLATSAGLTYRINLFDSEQNPDAARNDKEFLKTSLTTTGSIKNTRNFISLIESLPYNIKITRIDLKGGSTAPGSKEPTWTMMIDFVAIKILEKN